MLDVFRILWVNDVDIGYQLDGESIHVDEDNGHLSMFRREDMLFGSGDILKYLRMYTLELLTLSGTYPNLASNIIQMCPEGCVITQRYIMEILYTIAKIHSHSLGYDGAVCKESITTYFNICNNIALACKKSMPIYSLFIIAIARLGKDIDSINAKVEEKIKILH